MWYLYTLSTIIVIIENIIEIFNLAIRLVKIIPEKDPPLEDEIRARLYS